MTISPGTVFSQHNFILIRLISSYFYLFCILEFIYFEKFFSKHTLSSVVYRILSLITAMSGIDELNNTAELVILICAGRAEQNGLENRVMTPLESTIIGCRSAVVQKMDLRLRLATQVTAWASHECSIVLLLLLLSEEVKTR